MKTNTMVLGPVGSGKSFAIRTLLTKYPDAAGNVRNGAGKEVMLLALEPGAEATLGAFDCEMGLHIKTHMPATISWEVMEEWVERMGRVDQETIFKSAVPLNIRSEFDQFLKLYSICHNYTCDRCKKEFGPVDSWSDNRAFVVDGLSGLSEMAVHYVVGPKPISSQPQIGSQQNLVLGFLKKCVSIPSTFILIAHWSREVNETTGGTNITADTIGVKLAPKIAKIFDEIIVAKREGTKFTWSTSEDRMELKARRLPYASDLAPDFSQLFK